MVNKRGLSEIVTTLIMVLLGIVIVGVIWAVVSGFVGNARRQVESNTECQESTLAINYASCGAASGCNVTVKRETGTKPIAGVRISAYGPQGAIVSYDFSGDTVIGNTRIVTMNSGNFTAPFTNALNTTQIEATVYTNTTGTNFFCTNGIKTTNILKV